MLMNNNKYINALCEVESVSPIKREKCKFSPLSKQISWIYTGNNLGATLYLKTRHTFLLYFNVAFLFWEGIIQHICLCLLPVNTGVIWTANRGMALKELLLQGKHVCLEFQTKYFYLWIFFKITPGTALLCLLRQICWTIVTHSM